MHGADAHPLAVLQDQVQLGILLDHRNDVPPHLLGEHCHLDVLVVLEAIADDGGFVIRHRHDGHQFGLRAGFQTETVGLAEFQHLFHHLPLLVHLDGINATIPAIVFVLADGGFESAVNLAQPMFQDIGEADQDWETDAPEDKGVDQLLSGRWSGRDPSPGGHARGRSRQPRSSPCPSLRRRRGRWRLEGVQRSVGSMTIEPLRPFLSNLT